MVGDLRVCMGAKYKGHLSFMVSLLTDCILRVLVPRMVRFPRKVVSPLLV